MKKMLIALMFVLFSGPARPAHADSILDQLYTGFVGRAKFAVESTTKGTLQPEFLVNYVEVGQVNGSYIAAIDSGALGEVLHSGRTDSVQYTTGAKLHIAPLIKNYVHLPSEWEFLGGLEIDARASYNWSQHRDCFGVVAAYPFK